MTLSLVPSDIKKRFHVEEQRHACAILAEDFKDEFNDILECLRSFKLVRSEIVVGGGGKSKIAARFDDFLSSRGWQEKRTLIAMTVDGVERKMDTHKVDFCKGKVAVEVEWNNKDPFYARDLNAFRLLHELGVISVGVLITRRDELQEVFNSLGYDTEGKKIGQKYGASTTHWSKLSPLIEAGGNGSCPLLLVGITRQCYLDDMPKVPLRIRP